MHTDTPNDMEDMKEVTAQNSVPEISLDGPSEDILKPISDECPVGDNLRYQGLFDAVKEHRRDEYPNLPQGVWVSDVKRADWSEVARLCTEALSHRSKDLHFALWLTEAWTHLGGLRGFRRGLDLTSSLLEDFWPSIYPEIEEDGDLDYRLGPLRWASEQFPGLLRLIPITAPRGHETRPMTLKDWEDVIRIENIMLRDASATQKEQERYPTRAEIEASVGLSDVTYFMSHIPVAEACLGEFKLWGIAC